VFTAADDRLIIAVEVAWRKRSLDGGLEMI